MEEVIKRLGICVKSAVADLLSAAEVGEAEHLLDEEEAGESRENASDLLEAWNSFEEAWALEKVKRDRHESGCVARVVGQVRDDSFTCAWLKDGTKIVLHYIAGGTAVGMRHVPSAIINVQDADTTPCR
jgi:hypothetical protein